MFSDSLFSDSLFSLLISCSKIKFILLVCRYGTDLVRWTIVANKMNTGRVGKQVRERWFNHLDPRLKKGDWDKTEDNMLFKLQKQLGNKWSAIKKSIPGRSENAIKNRFNSAKFQEISRYFF